MSSLTSRTALSQDYELRELPKLPNLACVIDGLDSAHCAVSRAFELLTLPGSRTTCTSLFSAQLDPVAYS